MEKEFFGQPVAEVIGKRTSVRTYEKRALGQDVERELKGYLERLEIPFGNRYRIAYIPYAQGDEAQKLGTYGVIRNAPAYLGISVEKGDLDLAAAGYALEKVILYVTSLGLGTCWLGGTFKKSAFAAVMDITEKDLFPAITPVGYPQEKGHMIGKFIRKAAGSDNRKGWEELFFSENWQTALTRKEAGNYTSVLEGVRMGPSASNKQPWRIVRRGKNWDFYMAKTPGYNEKLGYAIQEVDLGIALCHFELAAREAGYSGIYEKRADHLVSSGLPVDTEYLISWTESK